MTLTHYDTREEWMVARRPLVTGSDAPIVLGLSPYTTPLALWSRKVGILDAPAENERTRLGHHLEGAILSMLAEDADVYVEPCRFALAVHGEHPELGYSPDGLVYADDDDDENGLALGPYPLGLAEVKSRMGFDASDDWADGVPPDVVAQAQHGMDVLDLPAAWVGVLLRGGEFRWEKLKRDPTWAAEKRPLLLEFARRVREEDPPDPTGSPEDRAAIVARYPVETAKKVVPLPPDAIDIAAQYRDAKDAEKRAKLAADEAANKLALLVGDAEEGLLPGDFGRVTFRTTTCPARVQEAYSFRAPRVWLKKEKVHG